VGGTASLRWRVGFASATALIVTATALAIALTAEVRTHEAGRELSARLVPAAAAAEALLKDYTAQQNGLRDYINSERPDDLAPFRSAGRQIPVHQARLSALIHPYPRMPAQLAAVEAAERAWLANVAKPQLAAAARGDFTRARAMQLNIPHIRPYVLAVRSSVTHLEDQIITKQQRVTDRLVRWQSVLITALLVMSALVAGIAVGGVAAVRHWLLAPFNALRDAVETVGAGHYDTPIPVSGPGEFAALARSTELMRTHLVTALAERERVEHGFRRLFQTAPDATLAVRQDGSIAMVNAQAERLFGYSSADLVGKQVEVRIPQSCQGVHSAHRRDYFANPKPRPMGMAPGTRPSTSTCS
jgi:PAS domain-containing protein